MSQADNQTEIEYINRDHLRVAAKAAAMSSGKSYYDTHEYSDRYFKYPENEKDRMFETIRQMASDAKQITNVIPSYFNEKKYDENEKGEGKLAQYERLVDHITGLAGFYVHTYTASSIDKDLKQVADDLQGKINEFLDQAGVILHPGKERFTFASDLEPFTSILKEPGTRYISELREQYGPEYTLCSDLEKWLDTAPHDLRKQISRQVKHLEEMQKTEKYHEEKKHVLSVVQAVKAFRISSDIQYEPEKAIDLLQSFGREYFGVFVDRDFPDLAGQIKWYENEKNTIFQELRTYLIAHPTDLIRLEFSKIRFVLTTDSRQDSSELISAFVRSSSPDGLVNFITQDYVYHPSFSFSRQLYFTEDSHVQFLAEKQEKIGVFAVEKFSSIWDAELEQNWATYSYLLGYISQTKNANPGNLIVVLEKIVNMYPKNLFFKIHHPAQMNQFCDFIEHLFLQTLDRKDLPKRMVTQLLIRMETHDQRYPAINERLDAIAKGIRERYNFDSNTSL